MAPVSERVASPVSEIVGGLPARLRAGVESLSGIAMDDVRVHRNSSEPAKLGALAFTRGTEIHLGPGQEEHLPHEAWHVVQQKQGRVQATTQMKGAATNDDAALEREADRMGDRAATTQTVEIRQMSAPEPLHVSAQIDHRRVIQRQPQPTTNILSPRAAAAAAADVTSRFDEDSIRTLESLAARPSDGVFDAADAEALAKAQRSASMAATGKADVRFLNSMLGIVGPAATKPAVR